RRAKSASWRDQPELGATVAIGCDTCECRSKGEHAAFGLAGSTYAIPALLAGGEFAGEQSRYPNRRWAAEEQSRFGQHRCKPNNAPSDGSTENRAGGDRPSSGRGGSDADVELIDRRDRPEWPLQAKRNQSAKRYRRRRRRTRLGS